MTDAGISVPIVDVTNDAVRLTHTMNRVPTRPRTIDAFGILAEQSGWIVERVLERPFSYNVSLVKAKTR